MSAPVRADREQILAYRLAAHHLAARLPPGGLPDAAGACGVQDTPPGAAALALHARVAGLTPAALDRALATDKSLVAVWSVRGAPHLVPTGDLPVFTLGALPQDETAIRACIAGAGPALDRVGLSAVEAVARAAAALREVLDGRALTKDALGVELARRVGRGLAAPQLAAWESPSWYAAHQRLGEAIVRFALAVVALRGDVCLAPRRGRAAAFVRTDQWLGPQPPADPARSRAELVRRYLRCYGPSTAAHFAAWAGIGSAQAAQSWALVAGDLVAVAAAGRPAWLHREDAAPFASPPVATGVRLLPPHDPFLALRDRATLFPDEALHQRVWRASGNPGVVLDAGRPVALWRARRRGAALVVAVAALAPLAPPVRAAIMAEAASLAPFRGCATATVTFGD